jgi:hypothetical protein
MFDSVYPYEGLGEITAAGHAVVDIANLCVPDTPDSTPPGALVVSASTTVEPSVWGPGDTDADGVACESEAYAYDAAKVAEIEEQRELARDDDGRYRFLGSRCGCHDGSPDDE